MDPRHDSRPSEFRADLDAALQTRKELGPEYESALIDSFLSRVDARLDARVEQRVAERLADLGPASRAEQRFDRPGARRGWAAGNSTRLSVMSLVFAIPLTGIGSAAGLPGMLATWAGIVGVNFAAALAGRHEQAREEQRRLSSTRSEWA
ncbi:hypothetical protein OG500_15375 [Kitasatospora sp. NBC_01250]|uniref:hypothetical protein n=1 Tax=unclassified Kitasatospora TaxID=2633591 RepID=UPI002E114160|nr:MULTISPECIES: hypothetical protein [unclassified Kitasatospora]WSJ67555.1 hypothetical protein OG294_16375 [Kitasatospora sp. NBC_01302]